MLIDTNALSPRSIADAIGTRDFMRFRLGIGRPHHPNVHAFVLSKFTEEEQAELPEFIQKAAETISSVLNDGGAAQETSHFD